MRSWSRVVSIRPTPSTSPHSPHRTRSHALPPDVQGMIQRTSSSAHSIPVSQRQRHMEFLSRCLHFTIQAHFMDIGITRQIYPIEFGQQPLSIFIISHIYVSDFIFIFRK